MKAITQLNKLPKFLTISSDFPEFLARGMNINRGDLVRVAPANEQVKEVKNLKQYVKVYAKVKNEWVKRVLGWKHLSWLKK